jgi:hypothetical protein
MTGQSSEGVYGVWAAVHQKSMLSVDKRQWTVRECPCKCKGARGRGLPLRKDGSLPQVLKGTDPNWNDIFNLV